MNRVEVYLKAKEKLDNISHILSVSKKSAEKIEKKWKIYI